MVSKCCFGEVTKRHLHLVAVSSSTGNSSEKAQRAAIAREKAGKIISSLVSMGMPADRLSVTELALANVEDTEVRVYTD